MRFWMKSEKFYENSLCLEFESIAHGCAVCSDCFSCKSDCIHRARTTEHLLFLHVQNECHRMWSVQSWLHDNAYINSQTDV